MDSNGNIMALLRRMEGISLNEMNAVKLMNRTDTKFITSGERLLPVLREAADHGYRVCEINGERMHGYHSLYFDTPGTDMYRIHRSGRLTRQKIRTRTYLASDTAFLEIKQKNNKGRTSKKRMEIPAGTAGDFRGMPEAVRFLEKHAWYHIDEILPACTTEFNRITLVNARHSERLTIDLDLTFSNLMTSREAALPTLVVIELKQDGRAGSEMKEILRALRIKPLRISKYCIGTALTNPRAGQGRFKEKLHQIEKVTHSNPLP